jgi:hypothetical protein
VNIATADPLADEYGKLLAETGIAAPADVQSVAPKPND